MDIIIVFALGAAILFCVAGERSTESIATAFWSVALGIFFLILAILGAGVYYSPITKSFSGDYVVKERFASNEKGNVAILYSVEEGRERIAEIKDWPPAGYSEARVGEKLMLIPKPNK